MTTIKTAKKSDTLPEVTAWSFTRYSDYGKCPHFFMLKHLKKTPEPPSPPLERGAAIHKLAEDYTLGKLRKLPEELALFEEEFAALKKQKYKIVEQSWTFDRNWNIVPWNDWKNAWVRIKMDAAYKLPELKVIVPIDHKTGKCRDEEHAKYSEQLDLYATGALTHEPDVEIASPRLWYLDHGIIWPDPSETELEYSCKELKDLQKRWEKKVIPLFKDRSFQPTPSAQTCRFCHYRKSNGGPCPAPM